MMHPAPTKAPFIPSTPKHIPTTMTQRNLTRYTYKTTSFQGWRLNICRKWNQFTRYFSDKQYGSEQAAFEAALRMRDAILAELKSATADPRAIFDRYKKLAPLESGSAA